MGPDELVDVPILHPLRHHHELVTVHCHTQQRQHVWMTKSVPGDYFFAKSLRESVSLPSRGRSIVQITDLPDLVKIAGRVHPRDLRCDRAALAFAFPHVRVSASVFWGAPLVVANRDLQCSRKYGQATADSAKSGQALPLQP